jgi:hypothetical protein
MSNTATVRLAQYVRHARVAAFGRRLSRLWRRLVALRSR